VSEFRYTDTVNSTGAIPRIDGGIHALDIEHRHGDGTVSDH